jgi:hypothetical protein
VSIGIHTSTIQIHSSWTIIDGEVFGGRGPLLLRPSARSIPRRIAKAARDMDAAKAEIARRIREKAKR